MEAMYTNMLKIMQKDRDYVKLIKDAKTGGGGLDQLVDQRATFTTILNDSRRNKITEAQEASAFVNVVNNVRSSLGLPPINWEEQ